MNKPKSISFDAFSSKRTPISVQIPARFFRDSLEILSGLLARKYRPPCQFGYSKRFVLDAVVSIKNFCFFYYSCNDLW